MVHFHSVGHVAHTTSCSLEFIRDKGYFVAAFYEALPELVSVRLDPTELWKGEICADKYAIFLVAVRVKPHWLV